MVLWEGKAMGKKRQEMNSHEALGFDTVFKEGEGGDR